MFTSIAFLLRKYALTSHATAKSGMMVLAALLALGFGGAGFAQSMTEGEARLLHGMSLAKVKAKDHAYKTMSPGAVMALLALSRGAGAECAGVSVDKKFHRDMRGKVNRGVFQSKVVREADGNRALQEFRAKHALAKTGKEKDSSKFCNAIRQEIAEGTFLGASLNLSAN